MLTHIDLRGGKVADLAISTFETPALEDSRQSVREIIHDVRSRGDAALRELAKKFDGAEIDGIAVPPAAIAANSVPKRLTDALRVAANRITEYQRSQLQRPHAHVSDGIAVTARSVAVKSAGLYVPGGKAAYPSTVLMTAIPARVAGVENIAICVPPDSSGEVSPATLAAAEIAGVDIVYRIGGAGAIAALAYGTESVAPVDVIAGPGNIYVALAQQEVAGVVGVVSGFAGPSEIAVIADSTTSPEFAAADLLTQAEHGPSGRAWLISPSEEVLRNVEEALAEQLAASPRRGEAEATLGKGGYRVLVDNLDAAVETANRLSPEHVQLMCSDAERLAQGIRNAGAVFCGPLSPAVIGDYIAGPSHVLPTGGTARFASGLQATDFQKRLHTISVSPEGFAALGDATTALAEAEGLTGHRDAVLARLANLPTEMPEASSKIGFLRRNIVELKGYHSPQLDVEVRLNTNESPYPPPEGFEEAVAQAVGDSSWNRYPQRNAQSLCSALGEFHDLPASQIFAANGSNEVIQTLLMCYGGAGRKVAVFQPTYALHSHIARSLSSELVVGERMPDFALDLEKTAGLIRRERPSVVFLCSPNNPTGLADSNESVSAVLEQTAAVGGLLVVDEAYAEFAPETALDLLEESIPLVVTRTYSKTWAMAAARLGYLAGPSQLVADLEKAALPYRLNSVTQAVGEIALRFREEMAVRVASIKSERARICAGLDDLGVRYWHSDANFILFSGDLPKEVSPKASRQASPEASAGDTDLNLADIPEGDPLWRRLVARSVLVRDCSSWPGLSGCLRVTVGTPEENSRFLSALSAVLQ